MRVAFTSSYALRRVRAPLSVRGAPCSVRRTVVTSCQRRVITTPLYYVNAAPHMGSAYPTIAADALARFARMNGEKTTFITGCDEHGEKIAAAAEAAAERGEAADTATFCERVAESFKDLWKLLDISYDRFVRTTAKQHAVLVQEFMERVWAKGDIYRSDYEGMYCTACEEYKDEKDLIDGSICAVHRKPCKERKEDNYFFALSNYQRQLEQMLQENSSFVQPPERRNEVLGWVKSGVRDFSVSREKNAWGIPVPRDPSQTIYVWFDALLGYISALLPEGQEPNLGAALANGWPADVHIIGKDILRFHAVYWPAMLMSADVPLPRRVFGHGFITKDGLKMGKSLGNTLDPKQLVATFGSDAVRYYFLRAVDFGRDGDFSEQRFVDIVNADLANSFGNLLNRSLNLICKKCKGVLPYSSRELGGPGADTEEGKLRKAAERAAQEAKVAYDALDFIAACDSVIAVSAEANIYIDRVAPWSAFKSDDPADIERAKRCLVNVLEAVRVVAVGLSPVTPKLSRRVYSALGIAGEFDELTWDLGMTWGRLTAGMQLERPEPVFPKLEITAQTASKPSAVMV